MDCQKQILVRRRADDVCGEEEGPRKGRRVAQEVGAEDLEADNEEDGPFSQRLGAAELQDLRLLSDEVGRCSGQVRTSGWALIIAIRLVRCGSSVYVQKKSC
jgi:hypothetical protein